MSNNADQPAYPLTFSSYAEAVEYKGGDPNGLTKREKLAMEIYVERLTIRPHQRTDDYSLRQEADFSLRAADIFFEQLNK